MTHELKLIFRAYQKAKSDNIKSVLATVVYVEGSSYRRAGVRMLILENNAMVGAVSGGCVEKEVCRQAEEVFATGIAKVMTYDGRYRLGCEGILYILLEPFEPDHITETRLTKALLSRENFRLLSSFVRKEESSDQIGTSIHFSSGKHFLRPQYVPDTGLETFEQEMPPCFRLVILGAEHDAVQLCAFAALAGWEVTVVASPEEGKSISDFQGAESLLNGWPEDGQKPEIDAQTAVVIMTHNFARDLKYLMSLKESHPAYLGILGPAARREKILDALIERQPEISDQFLDAIHGPAGLNIGAETSQEIAISILAEILTIIRNKKPMPLKDKKGTIHS